MKKIIAIIGARPQFIKHFPLETAAKNAFDLKTIHTGQHYDENMSQTFFDQLGMQKPDFMLSLGGGSHGLQTGKMLIEIEKILLAEKPDGIIVYGDTNSTLAGALAASKLHIPVFHIEAGLRSYNLNMPEEINRVMTDHVSSLLLVPSSISVQNLLKEGITENVHVVGDIMKDLVMMAVEEDHLKKPKIEEPFYYATLHRPYNVDEKNRLEEVIEALSSLDKSVVFAAHPRTQHRIKEYGIDVDKKTSKRLKIIDPQPYFENLGYLHHSEGLITDSGGMQKEAYWLRKKCITIRSETEWVETLENGCNKLVFNDLSEIKDFDQPSQFDKTLYGDGNASSKMIELMHSKLSLVR